MTQIEEARRGVVTPEMEFVADREGLAAELVRAEVAAVGWSSRRTRPT